MLHPLCVECEKEGFVRLATQLDHIVALVNGGRDFDKDHGKNRQGLNDPSYVGDVIDDTTFSFVCSLDEGGDPLTDSSCWPKANPLLGVTITESSTCGTWLPRRKRFLAS